MGKSCCIRSYRHEAYTLAIKRICSCEMKKPANEMSAEALISGWSTIGPFELKPKILVRGHYSAYKSVRV